jgi:hypothetical protein
MAWEDNIKTDIKEIRCEDGMMMDMTQESWPMPKFDIAYENFQFLLHTKIFIFYFHNLLYIICRICNKCICSISAGS